MRPRSTTSDTCCRRHSSARRTAGCAVLASVKQKERCPLVHTKNLQALSIHRLGLRRAQRWRLLASRSRRCSTCTPRLCLPLAFTTRTATPGPAMPSLVSPRTAPPHSFPRIPRRNGISSRRLVRARPAQRISHDAAVQGAVQPPLVGRWPRRRLGPRARRPRAASRAGGAAPGQQARVPKGLPGGSPAVRRRTLSIIDACMSPRNTHGGGARPARAPGDSRARRLLISDSGSFPGPDLLVLRSGSRTWRSGPGVNVCAGSRLLSQT